MTNNRHAKITPGWRLWRASVRELRAGWKLYLGATLIVVLPTRLLALSPTLASDGSFAAYTTIATIVTNLALFSLAKRRLDDENTSIRQGYYAGTTAFVRFVIVNLLLALCLIPAALGIVLINAGSVPGASGGEVVIVGLLGLLLAMPSLWLLARFVFASVIVATTSARPVESLRRARELTLGRFWTILGRLVILVLWLTLVTIACYLLVVLLAFVVHNNNFLTNLSQFLTAMLILPLTTIYLTKLHASAVETAAQ